MARRITGKAGQGTQRIRVEGTASVSEDDFNRAIDTLLLYHKQDAVRRGSHVLYSNLRARKMFEGVAMRVSIAAVKRRAAY